MAKIKIFGKEYTYQADKDEMYNDLMRIRLMKNITFKRVFQRNITDNFIASMKKVVDPNHRHENNTIWSMSGATGSGKSICVMSLIKMIVPQRFSHKNFCFYDEEILQLAKSLPKDSFIVRDEGTDKAVFGIGANRQSTSLQLLSEVSRKRGLSICFIEPEEKLTDITKWYMETVDMDVNNRITRVALKDPKTMEYIGAIYVPIVNEDDSEWVEYNIRKDKFMKDVAEGKLTGSKMNPKDLAQEIYDELDFEVFKTKKEQKAFIIQKYPHYTSGEINLIHDWLGIICKQNGKM